MCCIVDNGISTVTVSLDPKIESHKRIINDLLKVVYGKYLPEIYKKSLIQLKGI